MKKAFCPTFEGGARHGVAAGQTELAPPPYRPPFRGAVRVGQERSKGGAVGRGTEVARDLANLASRVERLSVSHRDPEAFFVERSEIASELRAAARVLPPAKPAGQADRGASLACLDLASKVSG
jgi:hypothetical protein